MKQSFLVLSYNLCFGKAFPDLFKLFAEHRPDIVCLQEFVVSEAFISQLEKAGYELADYSHTFFKHFRLYSVATFYNQKTIKHNNGTTISLSRGLYESILFILRIGRTVRTALNNNFILKKNQAAFRVCNVHLTAMQSTNPVRVKQLQIALGFLKDNGQSTPTIVMGDFNYVYKRKVLEKIFEKENYHEATNNLFYSLEWIILKFFKFHSKPDYIWYRNLKKIKTIRLNRGLSDHFPILTEFGL
ncbi:hypothetical protein A2313_01290 [Candidatus Roizmanbacteria bacterium RIFOXYB2_FULL_41_10]|uniref:Endonuclease/exonuclease/phosphatase domain-containing protein n=1 Tax=Candidatus Roizmanbacteria bacterium RIFOXYA1_FULL_41_12 TaxID=1802082 RepID=A0A1F7K929_9BACT|nr:MAG: hypothetical protein A2209_02505 [Candidatus Roizmanbacteria bacterium RIFOXYA1_FULL_41_12]OGK67626.1 MAG: hypothetical protein A2377_00635 [Candidatus Roizmanbacteria bacterium RIFOXYB1_FULL_41_27]OGK68490.1 MAG: hypothetical protein A2262_00995 [Candidatus Roizmanbacteria bacterium RIFOXYA2_FULL_41_8]OGK71014.1 MAG: hypothetical protein A2313_01290 [Candidatus Roizmanbacteria bacterium RIFOXYB2_FULL_41_10]OGK71348.1 MAG: hypothetical protein A2403_01020 [Candidatus Roizmanbacteria bac